MKKILLTQGKITLVDDKDFPNFSKHKWYFKGGYGNGYAMRGLKRSEGGKKGDKMVSMHRLIMNAPEGFEVDHINGDKLDNRRVNLRICLKEENHRNRGLQSNNTSGFKGVSRRRDLKKWAVHVNVDGKKTSVGHFDDLKEAAKAYNKAALKYYGNYARLNHV